MNTVLVVALICSSAIPASDCSRDNALDVVTVPAHTLQECMLQGPMAAAHSGLAGDKDTYVKTRCEQRH